MIRTLVVDDEAPARDRLRRLLAAHTDVTWIGEAAHGLAALEQIHALAPDLVLLDIQMPELDGLQVAAALPSNGPKFVFVTAHDTHAIRAFELAAVDYLLKPVAKERLAVALERVRSAQTPSADLAHAVLAKMDTATSRMAIRSGAKFIVFDTQKIAAIVAQDHYATLFVGNREVLCEESLNRLMARLDSDQFLRVHRSAILNVATVEELVQEGDRKYIARLAGLPALRIPISRERIDEVKRRIGAI
jgi:two-component system, LytTR family, response regulator